jgi:hypothetical protein
MPIIFKVYFKIIIHMSHNIIILKFSPISEGNNKDFKILLFSKLFEFFQNFLKYYYLKENVPVSYMK